MYLSPSHLLAIWSGKKMDEESGTFLLKMGLSSLPSLASTSCSRAMPRAQGRLDTQDL